MRARGGGRSEERNETGRKRARGRGTRSSLFRRATSVTVARVIHICMRGLRDGRVRWHVCRVGDGQRSDSSGRRASRGCRPRGRAGLRPGARDSLRGVQRHAGRRDEDCATWDVLMARVKWVLLRITTVDYTFSKNQSVLTVVATKHEVDVGIDSVLI